MYMEELQKLPDTIQIEGAVLSSLIFSMGWTPGREILDLSIVLRERDWTG